VIWLHTRWLKIVAWFVVMQMYRDGAKEFRRRIDAVEPVSVFQEGVVRCYQCYGFHTQKTCPLRRPFVRDAYDTSVSKWWVKAWSKYLRWKYYPDIPFDNGEEAPQVVLDELAKAEAKVQALREKDEPVSIEDMLKNQEEKEKIK
jgi:hypothetical protein